jgi:periplasmic protein CpxP/Spy
MKQTLQKLAVATALAGGIAFAQTPSANPQPAPARPGMRMRAAGRHRMMQALNLTDAQKAQAKTIFQQARQSAQPILQQLKTNRQDLAAAVKADDTARIQQLAGVQGNLRGQLTVVRADAFAEFYKTLTPDQKAKADQLHQQFQQRMEQRSAQHRNG